MRLSTLDVAVDRASEDGLLVQPRMGFSRTHDMRDALRSVRDLDVPTAGTITVDSYTRLGDSASAGDAVRRDRTLNGFPVVAHGHTVTDAVIDGIVDGSYAVQVRHGSPDPRGLFRTLAATRIDATEGGPISYALPYGRLTVARSVEAWREGIDILLEGAGSKVWHLESFGGCLMGQLCPPSLLIAVAILEGLFFCKRGVESLSLSYTQQTSPEQDLQAIRALRLLGTSYLPVESWHIVVYTYMGLFPKTHDGARRLQEDAVRLAVAGGAKRLIVKTGSESASIPSVEDNLRALLHAGRLARVLPRSSGDTQDVEGTRVYADADRIIQTVLSLDSTVGGALVRAFKAGYLDIPYCLHPDNPQKTSVAIDARGWLQWADSGRLPVLESQRPKSRAGASAGEFLRLLTHVRRAYDAGARSGSMPHPGLSTKPGRRRVAPGRRAAI